MQAQRRTPRNSVAYASNISYNVCDIIKESFEKKAVCYSIKQRSKLLLLQKEANTSKHLNSFFYCFYCLTSIFFVLFCFSEINIDVFTIFLSFPILKKCTFHGNIYIYTNGKVKPFCEINISSLYVVKYTRVPQLSL